MPSRVKSRTHDVIFDVTGGNLTTPGDAEALKRLLRTAEALKRLLRTGRVAP